MVYNKEAQRRQGVSEFWRALSFSLPIYRRRCGLNSWRGERGEISLREGEMHGNFHLSVGNCAATLVTRKRPPSQRPLLRMQTHDSAICAKLLLQKLSSFIYYSYAGARLSYPNVSNFDNLLLSDSQSLEFLKLPFLSQKKME